MKLHALAVTAAGIRRYLRWLGEPTDPPTLAPARGPAFFKSRVIRRQLGEPVQAELFDAHRARAREAPVCARSAKRRPKTCRSPSRHSAATTCRVDAAFRQLRAAADARAFIPTTRVSAAISHARSRCESVHTNYAPGVRGR